MNCKILDYHEGIFCINESNNELLGFCELNSMNEVVEIASDTTLNLCNTLVTINDLEIGYNNAIVVLRDDIKSFIEIQISELGVKVDDFMKTHENFNHMITWLKWLNENSYIT
jgi:hypothetical protein